MKIEDIKVNKILDSRGEWTIEVEIESEGLKEKTSIPSGKSIGTYEAICLNYEKIKENLKKFLKEIKNLNFQFSQEFDNYLIERAGENKKLLGANFILGLSISFARLLSKKAGDELYQYLKREYRLNKTSIFPKLVLNIIGGGIHSFNNLDFQEYWLVSKESFSYKLLEKILNIIKILSKELPKPLGRNDEGAFSTNFENNYEPLVYLQKFSDDFELGLDIAANQIKKNINFEEIYKKLKELSVIYLEDPYKEDQFEYFANLKNAGFKTIGDDLTVTNLKRLEVALIKKSIDGVIVKPNQIGTIKETFEFVKLAKENNLFTIFSHRSGETNDNWIIDLGIAFSADYFKIGLPVQGERVSKYIRMLKIYSDNIN